MFFCGAKDILKNNFKKFMLPKERLIFPLDVAQAAEARRLVALLEEEVGLFKVGWELFMATGRDFLTELATLLPSGYFLDLKLHDIPATMMGALRGMLAGVRFLTVHVEQSRRGLESLVRSLSSEVDVLGVTVLTSLGGRDLLALGIDPRLAVDPPVELVVQRARLAQEAGCRGVICAGTEAQAVKEALGEDFLVVCPAIRPAWAAVPGDDQKRVTATCEAIRAGADYVVVGRPIRTAADPRGAARRVVQEIKRGLQQRQG